MQKDIKTYLIARGITVSDTDLEEVSKRWEALTALKGDFHIVADDGCHTEEEYE